MPDNIPIDVILDRVIAVLKRQRKPISFQGPRQIEFSSPLFSDPLSPNWLALAIYDGGRIWIDEAGSALRYDLSSFQAFLFCAAIAFVLTGGGLLLHASPWVGLGAFVWLYGMNLLLAQLRVRGLFYLAVDGR